MDNLARYFDAAFLINLPERRDRLDSAIAALSHVGWQIDNSPMQIYPAQKFAERAGFPSAGARGAFHSHWACLKHAAANGARQVVIMEDDISLSPILTLLTPSITSWLDAHDWDFVYFGHHHTGSVPEATAKTKKEDFRFEPWTEDIQGLHFYGISQRVFSRLIAHLERISLGIEGDQVYGPMPIDGAINVFRRLNPDVKTFIAHPKLGWQRPSRSDITPKSFDRFRILRPIIGVLRNIKHAAAKAVRS